MFLLSKRKKYDGPHSQKTRVNAENGAIKVLLSPLVKKVHVAVGVGDHINTVLASLHDCRDDCAVCFTGG